MQQEEEQWEYFAQQSFQQLHVLPGDLGEQDFYEFGKMLQAKPPEKQLTDPMALVKQIQKTQQK